MKASAKQLPDEVREEVRKSAEILKEGGIILYPTDTIWGIGCDAANPVAVQRIYDLKQRPDTKSMLVLTDNVGKLASYVDVPDVVYDLLEVNDSPMTIIYPNARNLAANLIGPDRTLGIRVTQEAFSAALCYRFGKPIVSTSANVAGAASPRCFSEISEEIRAGVDYVVRYRQAEKQTASPSSILKIGMGGEIEILRK